MLDTLAQDTLALDNPAPGSPVVRRTCPVVQAEDTFAVQEADSSHRQAA